MRDLVQYITRPYSLLLEDAAFARSPFNFPLKSIWSSLIVELEFQLSFSLVVYCGFLPLTNTNIAASRFVRRKATSIDHDFRVEIV